MSITRTILIKSFVKPFYRQHAGLFVFIFIALFGAVGMIDGAGLLAFHLSLVQSILNNFSILLLVFIIWLLYAKKTEQFTGNILRHSDFSFLQMLSRIERKKLYGLLLWIQFLLFLPIAFYMVIIFCASIYLHTWKSSLLPLIYLTLLIFSCAGWNLFQIQHPGFSFSPGNRIKLSKSREMPYWSLLIRYIIKEKKILFAGIKIYSCVILYFMVINQTRVEYDLSMILLFFCLGILGHGLLIYQLRNLEETRLAFYRTIPRSLMNRFFQYALVYLVLLIPEFITILIVTPGYLLYKDAILFILLGYGLLLFLNSLLFIQFFRIKDYLKIILCIFLTVYLCILTASLPFLCAFLLVSSVAIFQSRYYLFERSADVG
jgi:hypothetical protein